MCCQYFFAHGSLKGILINARIRPGDRFNQFLLTHVVKSIVRPRRRASVIHDIIKQDRFLSAITRNNNTRAGVMRSTTFHYSLGLPRSSSKLMDYTIISPISFLTK